MALFETAVNQSGFADAAGTRLERKKTSEVMWEMETEKALNF